MNLNQNGVKFMSSAYRKCVDKIVFIELKGKNCIICFFLVPSVSFWKILKGKKLRFRISPIWKNTIIVPKIVKKIFENRNNMRLLNDFFIISTLHIELSYLF